MITGDSTFSLQKIGQVNFSIYALARKVLSVNIFVKKKREIQKTRAKGTKQKIQIV